MRKILSIFLRLQAKLILRRYKPLIIAVTGSVGKTSTKEAIFSVVKKSRASYRSFGNYNTEVGVPLSIVGLYDHEVRGAWQYLKALGRGKMRILFGVTSYPEVLVLEYGADRPGDIRYLVKHFPPQIAVVTAIGQIPVHLEYYKSRQELVAEKTNIVKKLRESDLAIINLDDADVAAMARKTKARVVTYGLDRRADVRASSVDVKSGLELADFGMQFKLEVAGKTVPVFVPGLVGTHLVYSLLAAAAVGLSQKISILDIVQSLAEFQTPPGRMRLLPGIKKTILIDDSYNSSPIAASRALDGLDLIKGGRKIAVLGDMLELGEKTEDAHRALGLEAGKLNFDFLVTVGPRAKFIADEARIYGFPQENLLSYDTADDARLPVQKILKQGDIVLVKGSRGMHLEKVVKEIMAEPARAGELLVH